jgi:hypothetical protein
MVLDGQAVVRPTLRRVLAATTPCLQDDKGLPFELTSTAATGPAQRRRALAPPPAPSGFDAVESQSATSSETSDDYPPEFPSEFQSEFPSGFLSELPSDIPSEFPPELLCDNSGQRGVLTGDLAHGQPGLAAAPRRPLSEEELPLEEAAAEVPMVLGTVLLGEQQQDKQLSSGGAGGEGATISVRACQRLAYVAPQRPLHDDLLLLCEEGEAAPALAVQAHRQLAFAAVKLPVLEDDQVLEEEVLEQKEAAVDPANQKQGADQLLQLEDNQALQWRLHKVGGLSAEVGQGAAAETLEGKQSMAAPLKAGVMTALVGAAAIAAAAGTEAATAAVKTAEPPKHTTAKSQAAASSESEVDSAAAESRPSPPTYLPSNIPVESLPAAQRITCGVGVLLEDTGPVNSASGAAPTAVVVARLAPGGPAAACGRIQEGDLLIAVNGSAIAGTGATAPGLATGALAAARLVAGPRGSRVELTLARPPPPAAATREPSPSLHSGGIGGVLVAMMCLAPPPPPPLPPQGPSSGQVGRVYLVSLVRTHEAIDATGLADGQEVVF